jgi:hypothetical protein
MLRRRSFKPLMLLSLITVIAIFEIRTRMARRAISSAEARSQQIATRLSAASSLIDFRSLPLDEALRRISTASGIPIEADWPMIEAAGLPRTSRVTANMSGATWEDVLAHVLVDCGGAKMGLTYSIRPKSLIVWMGHDPRYVVREYPIDPILSNERIRELAHWKQWSLTAPAGLKPLLTRHKPYISVDFLVLDKTSGWIGDAAEPKEIRWVAGRIIIVAQRPLQDQVPWALLALRAEAHNANK